MSTAPRLWWRRPGLAALVLWPAGAVWGAVVALRMASQPRHVSPLPVICAGSLTVGGDGKTPAALALAAVAGGLGLRAGFLTRGHGGSERGPLRVEPRHRAAEVGDEPLLLARAGPTVVSRDRAAGAKLLETLGVDIIVMDDGFQNPALRKDFSFALVDAAAGFGNRFVTPAGPLRASLRAQMERADAVVAVGEGEQLAQIEDAAAAAGRTLIRARLVPAGGGAARLGPVLAFAGIGRPEKLFASLEAAGVKVAERAPFPDHHPFTDAEAADLLARAERSGLRLVTTEKDLARLSGSDGARGRLAAAAEAFPVRLEFGDRDLVRRLLAAVVAKVRNGRQRVRPR